jgi:hypothetical protein
MGKRWSDPERLAELAEAGGGPELVKFWRSPVFGEKFADVPVFLLPRFTEMATELPDTPTGRRIYYERVHCLLALASVARRANPATVRLDAPPAEAELELGRVLGQAFHQGCSIADAALATGLPPDQVVAIGKRTIRGAKWLNRMTARPDLAT